MTSSCRVGASGYTIRRFARWLVVSPSPEGDGGEGGGDVGSTPHSRYPTTARSHPLCSLLCDIYKCICIHIYCWWTFSARGATTQQNQSSIEQKCWQDCVCKRPKKRNKREKKNEEIKKKGKKKNKDIIVSLGESRTTAKVGLSPILHFYCITYTLYTI